MAPVVCPFLPGPLAWIVSFVCLTVLSGAVQVRLLGICVSQPMMLVQELVPLGSLLNYLPKHRTELSTEVLILMAAEITSGMLYLEQQRCVGVTVIGAWV